MSTLRIVDQIYCKLLAKTQSVKPKILDFFISFVQKMIPQFSQLSWMMLFKCLALALTLEVLGIMALGSKRKHFKYVNQCLWSFL